MTVATIQPPEVSPKKTPAWLKAFVIFHIFAITVWALPAPPDSLMSGQEKPRGSDLLLVANARYLKTLKPIQAYLMSTGFWQYWDMFAPNPSNVDFYGDAEVIFKDGTHEHYQYPRMYLLPLPMKYQKERYRKFYERAHLEANTYIWPRFAQRIALLLTKDLSNPPIEVKLTRHWRPVAAPGKPQQEKYFAYQYYRYVVDQDLLKKEVQGFL